MTLSRYTFLEAVAQKQHYEKPTLRDLGCTPLGSLNVPHRTGDGSSSRRPFEPTTQSNQSLGGQCQLVWPRLQRSQDRKRRDLRQRSSNRRAPSSPVRLSGPRCEHPNRKI